MPDESSNPARHARLKAAPDLCGNHAAHKEKKMTREEVIGAFLVGDLVKADGAIGKLLCVDDRDRTARLEGADGWIRWNEIERVEDEEAAQIREHRKQVHNACRPALAATVPVILTKAAIDRCVDSVDTAGVRMVGVFPNGKLLIIRRNAHGDLIDFSIDLSGDDIELIES